MPGGHDLHVAHHLVGLIQASLPDQPSRRLGQLEAQQHADRGQQSADPVHPAPAVVEARTGLGERQAVGPGGGRGSQEQAQAGEDHREQQHVAPPDAVGHRREDEGADHVAGQVEHHRDPQRGHRVGRRAAVLERHAALDERHVDVEHVVEREHETQADDPDEHERHRPHADAVEPGQDRPGGVSAGRCRLRLSQLCPGGCRTHRRTLAFLVSTPGSYPSALRQKPHNQSALRSVMINSFDRLGPA